MHVRLDALPEVSQVPKVGQHSVPSPHTGQVAAEVGAGVGRGVGSTGALVGAGMGGGVVGALVGEGVGNAVAKQRQGGAPVGLAVGYLEETQH